jgi:hypothetical protein
MMNAVTTAFLISISILTAVPAAAQEEKNVITPPPGPAVERIAVFPFHNLTGSPAGYLEWYLPELIEKGLPAGKRLEIINPGRIAGEMKSRNLTARDLYEGGAALDLARDLGASLAVAGRFLHGAPGRAHVLGSESLLCTRQGEALAEQQGCRPRGRI